MGKPWSKLESIIIPIKLGIYYHSNQTWNLLSFQSNSEPIIIPGPKTWICWGHLVVCIFGKLIRKFGFVIGVRKFVIGLRKHLRNCQSSSLPSVKLFFLKQPKTFWHFMWWSIEKEIFFSGSLGSKPEGGSLGLDFWHPSSACQCHTKTWMLFTNIKVC